MRRPSSYLALALVFGVVFTLAVQVFTRLPGDAPRIPPPASLSLSPSLSPFPPDAATPTRAALPPIRTTTMTVTSRPTATQPLLPVFTIPSENPLYPQMVALLQPPVKWQPLTGPCAGHSPIDSPSRYDYGTVSAINDHTAYSLCGGQPSAGSQLKWLYKTNDRGQTWELWNCACLSSNTELSHAYNLVGGSYTGALFFLDEMHGWMSFRRGAAISYTTDGGLTWEDVALPDVGDLGVEALRFISPTHGYILHRYGISDGPHVLWETFDNGTTWQVWHPSP